MKKSVFENKNDSKKSKAQGIQPLTSGFTLNGVDQTKAINMIANFEKDYPADLNTTKAVSVWYSIGEIEAMNNLLIAEYNINKRPDGVRIYFGCDHPATGTGTKLSPVIFLVSTQLRNPPIPGKSNHEDYYDHLGNILPGGELGSLPIYDTDAALKNGALLYGNSMPADIPCNATPSGHYINGADAYAAVQRHMRTSSTNDVSAYNTKAEWFEFCFITSVFNAILDTHNQLNGLRIYFGKRIMDDRRNRDVFILVPTHDVNGIPTDTYQCLEGLNSFGCDSSSWTDALTGDKTRDAHITFLKIAGYDKGELCPTNCN